MCHQAYFDLLLKYQYVLKSIQYEEISLPSYSLLWFYYHLSILDLIFDKKIRSCSSFRVELLPSKLFQVISL